MKNLMLIFSFLTFAASIFAQNVNETTALNNILSIWGYETTGTVTRIKEGIKDNNLLRKSGVHSLGLDLNFSGSTKMEISVNKVNKRVTTYSIPFNNDIDSKFMVIFQEGNNYGYTILTMNQTSQNDFTYVLDDGGVIVNDPQALGCWGECMHAILSDSHVGDMITVGGVLGGLGCGVCAGVARVLTGTAAIGCLGCN